MLDRLFLSKLNSTGKAAYWIGQISLILVWIFIVFGPMGMSLDDGGEGMLILGIVGIVAVWGVICIIVWPIGKVSGSAKIETSNTVEQVKVMEEQIRD